MGVCKGEVMADETPPHCLETPRSGPTCCLPWLRSARRRRTGHSLGSEAGQRPSLRRSSPAPASSNAPSASAPESSGGVGSGRWAPPGWGSGAGASRPRSSCNGRPIMIAWTKLEQAALSTVSSSLLSRRRAGAMSAACRAAAATPHELPPRTACLNSALRQFHRFSIAPYSHPIGAARL